MRFPSGGEDRFDSKIRGSAPARPETTARKDVAMTPNIAAREMLSLRR